VKGYDVAPERLRYDHRIYEAIPDTLLLVTRGLPAACASAALVGHNPGATDFVNALVGKQVVDALPTFGVAILEIDAASWADVSYGGARLAALHSPKTIRD